MCLDEKQALRPIRFARLVIIEVMDVEISEIEIKIEANVGKQTASGAARIRVLKPLERVKKTLRKLGLFWGIGLFCVLFPLVHFVLVPLFLLLGIYFAVRTATSDQFIVSGLVLCPECHKPFILKPALARWPLDGVCENCLQSIQIHPRPKVQGIPHLIAPHDSQPGELS